jgi:hypothetical protein
VELHRCAEVAAERGGGLLAIRKAVRVIVVRPRVNHAQSVDVPASGGAEVVERVFQHGARVRSHGHAQRGKPQQRALGAIEHDREELALLSLGHQQALRARCPGRDLAHPGRDAKVVERTNEVAPDHSAELGVVSADVVGGVRRRQLLIDGLDIVRRWLEGERIAIARLVAAEVVPIDRYDVFGQTRQVMAASYGRVLHLVRNAHPVDVLSRMPVHICPRCCAPGPTAGCCGIGEEELDAAADPNWDAIRLIGCIPVGDRPEPCGRKRARRRLDLGPSRRLRHSIRTASHSQEEQQRQSANVSRILLH